MSERYRVLLVEDDALIARTVKLGLPYKGFDISVCETCVGARALLGAQPFDLLLLDVGLPDGNGIDFCRELRARFAHLPILMVTARTEESAAVAGLESGADDYIRKPYGLQELAARMHRLLEKRPPAPSALNFGPLKLDPAAHTAFLQDLALALGKREFDILHLMVRKAGAAVTRNEILDTLGEEGIYDRTIDSHISHLRRKLKEAGGGVQISAIYGVGYRLE